MEHHGKMVLKLATCSASGGDVLRHKSPMLGDATTYHYFSSRFSGICDDFDSRGEGSNTFSGDMGYGWKK
jgi:hypothetical protein